jgi:hypothetical protein
MVLRIVHRSAGVVSWSRSRNPTERRRGTGEPTLGQRTPAPMNDLEAVFDEGCGDEAVLE